VIRKRDNVTNINNVPFWSQVNKQVPVNVFWLRAICLNRARKIAKTVTEASESDGKVNKPPRKDCVVQIFIHDATPPLEEEDYGVL
jgi:hypothetical protein